MKRIAFILLIFSAVTSVQAQSWTLETCINYAIEHNIAIKQIELQKENAAIDLNTAKMSRLPDLSASVGQEWGFGYTSDRSNLNSSGDRSNMNFSLGSSMPLFTGFRIPNEIERNKLEWQAAVQSLEKAKEDVALNIASLFLQALFNKEMLKVAQEQWNLSQAQVEKTQILVSSGKVPQSQLYDIEAQVAKDEVSVIEARNNVALALLDLAQNLELEPETLFDIQAPEISDILAQSVGGLQPAQVIFDHAVNNKPVIKEQQYKVESAERALNIAKSGYYPNLSLNMGYRTGYSYTYGAKDYTNQQTGEITLANPPFFTQFKDNGHEYIGLSLSIPIFNRFSVRNQVRSTRLNIDNRQWELEKARKTLYKEIQTAYQNAVAAYEKYLASEKSVRASTESFRYTQERYEIGKSSVFEFNEAKTKLIQSRSEQIRSEYDYVFRVKILDFYNGVEIRL
ncbi:MAG: TolC family protein [Dysgonamonadaceae bacterium]|jgi:outer membrane protein|nr:TolC family protein [Dysgonamonadaceae bacterium]